jgi:hypothetical protein
MENFFLFVHCLELGGRGFVDAVRFLEEFVIVSPKTDAVDAAGESALNSLIVLLGSFSLLLKLSRLNCKAVRTQPKNWRVWED